MKQLIVVSALLFFLFMHGVLAAGLEYYGVEATINEDLSVKNTIVLKFDKPVSHFDYQINGKIYNFSASPVFDSANCRIIDMKDAVGISCDFKGMTKEKNTLKLVFYTLGNIREIDDKYQFVANYGIDFPIKEAFILVRLPRNGVLAENVANKSYFPSDGKFLTDGKHIMVYWDRENLESGENLRFSVFYDLPFFGNFMYYINNVFLLAGIVIVAVVVFIYFRKEKTAEEVVKSVLNKDEKKIVDILNSYGGHAGQKVLVRETDFSKAKVSRLVKALAERNVVEIEPISGRENKISLKIKK